VRISSSSRGRHWQIRFVNRAERINWRPILEASILRIRPQLNGVPRSRQGDRSRPASGTTSRLPSFIGQWGYFWPSTSNNVDFHLQLREAASREGYHTPQLSVTPTVRRQQPRAIDGDDIESSSSLWPKTRWGDSIIWTFPTHWKGQEVSHATPTWERLPRGCISRQS
jgi:hypothetical protein